MFNVELLYGESPFTLKPSVDDKYYSSISSVDTTRAGKGQLAVSISTHGKSIAHHIEDLAVGVHRVTFTPLKEHPHSVEVKLNGVVVPTFPRMIAVRDPARHIIVHGTALKSAPAGKPSRIFIDTAGRYSAECFDVIVSSPTNQPCEVKLFAQKDSNLLAQWTPNEIGGFLFIIVVVVLIIPI